MHNFEVIVLFYCMVVIIRLYFFMLTRAPLGVLDFHALLGGGGV